MYTSLLVCALAISGTYALFEEELVSRQERGLCKNYGESCRGVPTCCNDMKCYWKNGYSMRKAGVCVICIERGQTCQRDSTCCGDLVCQKGGAGYMDGVCADGLPNGSKCHEDDNCLSENCEKKRFFHIYGLCQAKDTK